MAVLARLLVVFALLLPAAPAPAEVGSQPVAQHLFYEAVPPDAPADASYEARRRLTERVRDELLPAVLRAAGVEESRTTTEPRMGGYRLRTNPSLHSTAVLTDAEADHLAATLGRVLRQDSVLVADFAGGDGTTGYALVRFPDGTLTPETAQRFFVAAATAHEGLGGGYTAFGDSLLFLNLRGADGTPYSGLSDADFTAALARATQGFAGVALAETGRADARLVESPPDGAPIPDGALSRLRERHGALLTETLTPEAVR